MVALTATCATTRARTRGTPWSITVLGDSTDPRFIAVREAAGFWNEELAKLGVPLRLGVPNPSHHRLPELLLRDISATVIARRRARRPAELDTIPGDVVVALSRSGDMTSVGIGPERLGGRGLVILRPGHLLPLSAPNVARNVAAHELGHVLGLRHNTEPGTLMCMPPAPCRPMSYRADTARFFPLTATEQRRLRRRWGAS
jgi:Matrixin